MIQYRPRWISGLLNTMCREAPIVVLTGPRQVGKSTLLKNELMDEFKFLNLDDLDILAQVKQDSQAILSSADRIIIDEAQRAPDLFLPIKKLVDEHPHKRFILSGSANLLLMATVSDSLAGRAQFLHLSPMTQAELQGKQPPTWLVSLVQDGVFHPSAVVEKAGSPVEEWVWQGGMPVTLQRTEPASLTRWREGYIESYLERDLRQLSQIDSLTDFRRLMKLAALRNSQVINQSELARDAGLSQPTAHRYLSLLETGEWIHSIKSFVTNRTLQVMRRPRLDWFDTGIAVHLQGLFEPQTLTSSREWGALLETYVMNQIRPVCGLVSPKAEVYYWRLRDGTEVDAVIQRGSVLIAIEIKSTIKARYEDTRGLQSFLMTHPQCCCGLVFYRGATVEKMTEKIWAVPITGLTG